MPVIHHVVPHVPVYVSVHVVIPAMGAHPTVIMYALDVAHVRETALNTAELRARIHVLAHATLVAVEVVVDALDNAKADASQIVMQRVVVDALKVVLDLAKVEKVELHHALTALDGQ